MTKAGESMLRGARQALAFAKGETKEGFVVRTPDKVDVRAIRKQLGLSQSEFAARYGFSLGNVQNWEQGHRKPAGAARVLLTVIKNEPKAVDRALRDR
jgi:putative transcriptional regulator